MSNFSRVLFPAMWLSWAAYWWLLSRDVKASVRTESLGSRLAHIAPLAVAVLLLCLPSVALQPLMLRFVPWAPWTFWVGAALTFAGLAFTVWARVHLWRNWSGIVTLKQDHELVTGGPYAIVRHPIYTGLLLAFVGSALARGEWRGILAVALVFVAFERKRRHEERWMREQFGAAYDAYAGRVAALIPYLY